MNIKHTTIISALMLASAMSAAAEGKPSVNPVKVHDIEVSVDDRAGTLNLKIDIDMTGISLSRDREIIYTPVIISEVGTDSLELDPITIAGRNRWYWHLRNSDMDAPGSRIYRAGTEAHAVYAEQIPFEPWMGQSLVEMRVESANCCDTPEAQPGPGRRGNTDLALIDTRRPPVVTEFLFTPPVDAGPVIKSIEGSAFVTFVVNRTELKPDYMINRRELAKIINSIDYVRNDKDATITHVHIKGYASPEGPYDNNVRLARGRTETLRRYVRDLYSFPDTTITSSYEPEDWAGLRTWLTDSLSLPIGKRSEIIAIVDSDLEPDARDRAIKTRYPAEYAVILKEIYPWLRHSDYTVTYSIRTFTSVEEIREVFHTDPSRLRNVDFYTLAQSYPEGSQEYCDVFEKAVEIYPDDPISNLNAANIEMKRGDYDRAQSHLYKSGSSAHAIYARGVLAAKRGDLQGAIREFEQAKKAGITEAQAYIDNIRAVRDYNPVTILVEPTKN
ncbi:MAG: DUF3868 domain-containing protein [Staphylococcus sp.]|nr:DUF3868 domain-containing protein [Staphylococcus sp.]